ncbi:hypothetical protein Tco_1505376 [Tanacetum coccineum]
MAGVNDVPQLVDKKGGSYVAIAPKLEPKKFNKWKKKMLCYLAGMEPYYLKCIKDGPFQPKIADGDAKPERYSDTKKALITTPSSTAISTALFSNNVIQDFQENSDDEVDERSSKEYLRDLDIKYHERAILANSKHFIKRRNNFSGQKSNETLQEIRLYRTSNSVLSDYLIGPFA